MAKVNVDLYEFLKETSMENGLYYDHQTKEMIAYTHIYFWNLEDFVKIIGDYWFEEGGLDVKMFDDTICVDLNGIFESDDNCILDYKNCFNESDIEQWREELEKQ